MDLVVARSGSGASTGGSSVVHRRFEPLLRTTDNLVPVPSLARFPVATGVGVVVGGLSILVPLALLIVILSTGTGRTDLLI